MKMVSIPAEWQTPTQPFPQEKVEYLVHLKYVRCIARLSKGLTAISSLTPGIGQHELGELQPKLRLAERITMTSLAWEIEAIESDPEYAHACIAWLPAKVYYNLYHFLSLIEYIITSDKQLLRVGHNSCLRQLADRIAGGTIIFSCPLFNTVHDKAIQDFTTRSGEVLSNTISDDRLLSLIMKKIAKDKLHDYQVLKGLNLRKKRIARYLRKKKTS